VDNRRPPTADRGDQMAGRITEADNSNEGRGSNSAGRGALIPHELEEALPPRPSTNCTQRTGPVV
jgi:hypothetical protein